MPNEAAARLKINHLLTSSGWRLLDEGDLRANVHVEAKSDAGFADYLLFDRLGFPLAVIEAKAPQKSPLVGKEQARAYAKDHHVRFAVLSNGDESYLWDIAHGNPEQLTTWPSPEALEALARVQVTSKTAFVDPYRARGLLAAEAVADDYIARTQDGRYDQHASWKDEHKRSAYIAELKLRFLRPYQIEALRAIQSAVASGKTGFLLEMATGTGKTLTSAALIKLFLRSGAAHRVLFLVDRLELEDQAQKAFVAHLARDYRSVIYKQHRSDWRQAHIVVTTVQSLMASDRYREEFRPSDFGLVISDEAHRSISGRAREVFDYFRGYKLGLTATPRDLLRGIWAKETGISEFELEKRVLFDTYRVFGCESGVPTYRFGLLDGVKGGYLVNPTVLDCRTDKTTQLLSEQGLAFEAKDEDGNDVAETFGKRDFERTYFSPETNQSFVATFLDHALTDPITHELGKSLIFCVSQSHAAKITNLLNQEASRRWPGRYQSDFALQVTSSVADAQAMTVRFSENTLGGKTKMVNDYTSSRVRICVTVGMMTTGYDCADLLNVVLMRPVFSPSEFIQMKGRGTRLHTYEWTEPKTRQRFAHKKTGFHLFDFFANYEFFEAEYDYDAVKPVPLSRAELGVHDDKFEVPKPLGSVIDDSPDALKATNWITIGVDGMKIDRLFWQDFSTQVTDDADIADAAARDDWDRVSSYIHERLLGGEGGASPIAETDTSDRGRSLDVIRTLLARRDGPALEALFAKLFGRSIQLPTKQDLLTQAFERFARMHPPRPEALDDVRFFFFSYVGEPRIRALIDEGRLAELNSTALTPDRLKRVPDWRGIVKALQTEVDWDRFGA